MNKLDYLSKSSFILALSCRTKLFYYKLDYPKKIPLMGEQLIEDGYKIGKFAQIIYGPGEKIDISLGLEEAIKRTEELINSHVNLTIFEATFLVDNKLVIVDILEKRNNTLFIKEVKSKSIFKDGKLNNKNKNSSIKAEWIDYYKDIAYQYFTLKTYFEKTKNNYSLRPFLVVVDNTKAVDMDGLSFMFETLKDFDTDGKNSFNKIINFIGNEADVKRNNILIEIEVIDDIQTLLPDIENQSSNFIKDLENMKNGKKYISEIKVECKKCEFTDEKKNGFKECWGKLAEVEPHIFGLYQGTRITHDRNNYFNELISKQVCSIYDIDQSLLTSAYGERQKIQINYTKNNLAWLSNSLNNLILKEFKYPLYFIDFETARLRIPPYRGMKPNDTISFQWSCHMIENAGNEPQHFEFLNDKDIFPNFIFAQTLMDRIGEEGTFFMWHYHETTTLKEILKQIQDFGFKDSKLKAWLVKITQNVNFIDMRKLTLDYFFHPDMKGSNSLKDVLPAIWQNYASINKDSWFSDYFKEISGVILDPYETLGIDDVINQADAISEGAGAIIGYQKFLQAIREKDINEIDKWKSQLLKYCELDTMAMVMIWKHWLNLANKLGEDFPVSD